MDTESQPEGQRRKSVVARFAGRFRGGSATSADIEPLDAKRDGRNGSAASIRPRNSSVASSTSDRQGKIMLPLTLARTRVEESKEDVEASRLSVP